MILGVDVRDDVTAAVVADDRGVVAGRGSSSGSDRSAIGQAVRGAAGVRLDAVGIAVRDPLAEDIAEVVAAVKAASGTSAPPRVISRGGAVTLGEQWLGAAQGGSVVMGLVAADHVHAGLVIGGQLFEGAHRAAGAAAWLALNPVEREDYRRLGCLEAEIGRAGIVRRLIWRIKSGDESCTLEMAGGDIAAITVEHVFDAARTGDGVAISVMRDTARYVGMAIANLVTIADPDVVLLGGLIADAADQLLEPSKIEALRRLPGTMSRTLEVAVTTLGEDGGPLGAARAAMRAP